MPLTPENQALLTEWETLKTYTASATAREKELRLWLADVIFSPRKLATGAFPEGTVKEEFDGGKVSLETKYNYTVLEELYVSTINEAGLTAEETAAVFKTTVEIKPGAYKKLPEEKRKVIDKMLVIKQGSITLKTT